MQKFVFPIPPDPSAFLASFVSIKIFPSLELCCYLVSSMLNDYCWVSWNNRHKVSNGPILCITPVTSNQINPNSLNNNKQNNFNSFSCNTLIYQYFILWRNELNHIKPDGRTKFIGPTLHFLWVIWKQKQTLIFTGYLLEKNKNKVKMLSLTTVKTTILPLICGKNNGHKWIG